jgi:hypothetical protein
VFEKQGGLPFSCNKEAAFPFISLGFRPDPAYLQYMEISNISMDPSQPYMLGQLDETIFPYGIPMVPIRPPELLALPPPSSPIPDDSTQNLDIYA